MWESPSGDDGSWYQINKDGFGTETTVIMEGTKIRTNQDFGSEAIYNGYLYIGTLSHYGAQVWRYDGTGLNGWEDVTPEWLGRCYSRMVGVDSIFASPSRATSMVVYNNSLYMAEGYPTGNLDKTISFISLICRLFYKISTVKKYYI